MKKLIGLVVVLVLLLVVALQPSIKKQKEYTIVYYVGSDVRKIPTMTVQKNGKAFKPADPIKENAEFSGWYLVQNPTEDDEVFDFENTKITESITLYVNWAHSVYTIEYDLNGGYWPDEPYQDSFTTADSRIFLKPSSSSTHPRHDNYGRFTEWRAISQEEFLKLSAEEQKEYPAISSITPTDPSTLSAFDENKHLTLYAYFRNYTGE